jgi:hypothetical protein
MSVRFSALDRRAIRRLQPGEKANERGITAERLAAGDVRYSVNIMVDGKRIHRVVGLQSDGVTRTQCEEFIAAKRTEARAGRLQLPKGRKLALTFAAAADRYTRRLEEGGGKNLPIKRRQQRRISAHCGWTRSPHLRSTPTRRGGSIRGPHRRRSIASSPPYRTCSTAPWSGAGSTACRCGSASASWRRARGGSSR